MKIRLLQLAFLFISCNLFGYEISGTITDAKTNLPVEFATIYVNGTTIGTISDINGNFHISYNLGSCKVVVSHTSYQNKVIDINSDSVLTIQLDLKIIKIRQVSIISQDLRASNMKYFKDAFLGKDFWSEKATIKNDSVITFNVKYNYKRASDSSLVKKYNYFEVQTSAPLIIELTELGYILEYDLVKFIEKYNEDIGASTLSYLGYSYFNPIEPKSRLHSYRLNRNRNMAYYNSTMHFMRSLFENKLNENGYLLYHRNTSDTSIIVSTDLFELEKSNSMIYHSNEAYMTGMKGEKFLIKYYGRKRKPININISRKTAMLPKYSYFFVLDDSCLIRRDGTLPGGQIVFSKSIVKKE